MIYFEPHKHAYSKQQTYICRLSFKVAKITGLFCLTRCCYLLYFKVLCSRMFHKIPLLETCMYIFIYLYIPSFFHSALSVLLFSFLKLDIINLNPNKGGGGGGIHPTLRRSAAISQGMIQMFSNFLTFSRMMLGPR